MQVLLLGVTSIVACAACPTTPHAAQLSKDEVIEVANEAARKAGANLARYAPPEAHFEYVENNCKWAVFYESINQGIGDHFEVIVEDRTRRAKVFPGT